MLKQCNFRFSQKEAIVSHEVCWGNQATPNPPFFHRFTISVSSCFVGFINSDFFALSGIAISYKASVGQEPMQDKTTYTLFSTTITGLLPCFRLVGLPPVATMLQMGNVQYTNHNRCNLAAMIATIDWPMNTAKLSIFKNNTLRAKFCPKVNFFARC